MNQKNQNIGKLLQEEANDLKRDETTLAGEIGWAIKDVESVFSGNASHKKANDLAVAMGKMYPIDHSDLYLPEDDSDEGVKFMRREESKASTRILFRKDKKGKSAPFYEYRDTAMSRICPIKPEWIKELRTVSNSDPNNPDVQYNRGHFMHQLTFFAGDVNFYWQVDGKKHSAELTTGDSNHITPFHPHSFTSRNPENPGLIIAVTYGGDVRRARKEMYTLNQEGIESFSLNYRNPEKASAKLIQQHMANSNMTSQRLIQMGILSNLEVDQLLGGNLRPNQSQLEKIAKALNVEPYDLSVPNYKPEDEVVIKRKIISEGFLYPDKDPQYLIHDLASTSKMPQTKGFDLEIITQNPGVDFKVGLHSYIYNYGKESANLFYGDGKEDVINPGDSLYIKPWIGHSFTNKSKNNANLCVLRVGGSVNLLVQRELSTFSDTGRIVKAVKWYDDYGDKK